MWCCPHSSSSQFGITRSGQRTPTSRTTSRSFIGRLDRDEVLAAGVVHSRPPRHPETVVSEALRLAIYVDTAIRRGNMWQSLRGLDEVRWRLHEVFALTHGRQRPAHAVDAFAGPGLREKFARTIAQADSSSIMDALETTLDLLENTAMTDRKSVV